MMEFTRLERAVLDWIAEHVDVPNLAEQIRVSVPTEREHTGCGSFTTLSVPSELPPVKSRSPIYGPVIKSEGIEHGGGALIFLDDKGHIETLEMYASGDRFAEVITDFTLEARGESN